MQVRFVVVILAVLIGASVMPLTLQAQVNPVPNWVNFYGGDSTIDGDPVPVGTTIQVYDSSGVQCGAYTVKLEGTYGYMACYIDDPDTPTDEGITPGESVDFVVNGISAGSVMVPASISNGMRIEYNFAISSPTALAGSCVDGYEPDDDKELANSLTGPESHTFYSEEENWDQDWATFDAKANWTYQIKARSWQPLSMVHPVLRLYDGDGNLLAENRMDKWGRGAEIWWWNGGGDREMVLLVEEDEGRYGCLHYTLMLHPFSPDEMASRFQQ